jgi:hypothetical protein
MRKIIGSLVIATGLTMGALGIGMSAADAHQQPYDSGIQTEHNLCQIMRPYGVGTVVGHYRITGTHRQCFVCISNDLYAYEIQYASAYGGWSGPWDTTLITSNSSAC